MKLNRGWTAKRQIFSIKDIFSAVSCDKLPKALDRSIISGNTPRTMGINA